MAELSADEARLLCSEGVRFVNNLYTGEEWQEVYCQLMALDSAASPADCEAQITSCVEGGYTDMDSPIAYGNRCNDITEPVTGCTLTVADIEACWNEFARYYVDVWGTLSCADIGMRPMYVASPGCAVALDTCGIVLGTAY